jgi:hypothetical protein
MKYDFGRTKGERDEQEQAQRGADDRSAEAGGSGPEG